MPSAVGSGTPNISTRVTSRQPQPNSHHRQSAQNVAAALSSGLLTRPAGLRAACERRPNALAASKLLAPETGPDQVCGVGSCGS